MNISKKQAVCLVAVVAALYLFLHYFETILLGADIVLGAITPLVIGAIFAYIINIPMQIIENKWLSRSKHPGIVKMKRLISMLLSFALIIVIIAFVLCLVVPELKDCIVLLTESVPDLINQGIAQIQKYPQVAQYLPEDLTDGSSNMQTITDQIVVWLQSGMAVTILDYFSSVLSMILNVFMGIFFCCYLLAGKERLKSQIRKLTDTYLPEKISSKMYHVISIANQSFHSFVAGQFLEAMILGTLTMIGMLILRLPYSLMVGVIIGCTALIPIMGAYVGTAIGAIVILTVSPMKAVIFLVFILLLQQVEGQLIYPRVVGSSIGLPGIWVFTAVVAGGGIFGIPGILLGIPLAATAYHLLAEDVAHRRKKS